LDVILNLLPPDVRMSAETVVLPLQDLQPASQPAKGRLRSKSRQAHPLPQQKPWKEIGYRGFSAFLASDNDFLIFRRFGAINARLLLYLQDEIAVLEEELEELEAECVAKNAEDIHNGSFRLEALPERTEILEALNMKVRQYSE
jgi:hypothetical protein